MLITLTTDFGVSSPYVGALKGSLLSTNSAAQMIDLTHAIGPQNVRQAAVVLADVTPFFPPGTLHVVVVDPGVGTERKIVYAEIGEQLYLAPDNGVLSYLIRSVPPGKIIELTNRKFWRDSVSNIFHGRDIFAPVAGHLAAGVSPTELGCTLTDIVRLRWFEPQFSEQEVRGEVLNLDSFGNVITNISVAELRMWLGDSQPVTYLHGREILGLQTTYGHCRPGEPIALADSQGRLELAVVNGSAASVTTAKPGDIVQITRK